jgi:hypothetical protein
MISLRTKLALSAFAIFASSATAASASPIETLTFSGTLGYGTDSGGTPQFGSVKNASLTGDVFTIALSYNPTSLTGDSCGVSTTVTNCNWSVPSASESITVNGITHTYTGTGGNIGIGVNSDQINFSIGGTPQFGLNVSDGSSLFASTTNGNFTTYNFSNVAVTGNFGSSGLSGASLGGSLTTLSASFTNTSVPEPFTLSLFGAGLAGAAAFRRRREKKKA